ncbi:UNVERIFIED_CONTAM: hypothetical protein FKN15_039489 [Acipenser sinensis]
MVLWLNPAQKTSLQIGEVFVVEQFCHVVGAETQAWIRCHNPDIMEKALKLTEDFEDSQVSTQTAYSPLQHNRAAAPPSPGPGKLQLLVVSAVSADSHYENSRVQQKVRDTSLSQRFPHPRKGASHVCCHGAKIWKKLKMEPEAERTGPAFLFSCRMI